MSRSLICILVVSVMASCGGNDPKPDNQSIYARVGVDESYTLMMDSQAFAFQELHDNGKLHMSYKPEGDVIQDLLDDSVEVAVIGRQLSENEKAHIRSKQRVIEELKIAMDGVALVLNPENPDSNLTMDQVTAIFQGRDSLWSQLGTNSTIGNINIVFDNARSCNARYIKEKFVGEKPFPSNCFAVHSNQEVIEYVRQNKNALGVISVAWISDKADSTSRSFLKDVRVAGIQNPATSRPDIYRKPVQAYIFDGSYPLIRDVFVVETAMNKSVGTSFVKQIAGEKGQLIIKRMGLAPVLVTPRQIKIVNE